MLRNPIHLLLFASCLIVTTDALSQTPDSLTQTPAVKTQDTFASSHSTKNKNFFVISAIKSISGDKPDDEFFAAQWRYTYGSWLYSLANLDIALSDVGTDTVGTTKRRLSEAGIALVGDITGIFDSTYVAANVRSIFVGGIVKIFNSEAYFGATFGSLELQKSSFRGSHFQLAYLRRFYETSDASRFLDDGTRLADDITIRIFPTLPGRCALYAPLTSLDRDAWRRPIPNNTGLAGGDCAGRPLEVSSPGPPTSQVKLSRVTHNQGGLV